MLRLGTIIDGRFEIIEQVGVGGMGIVYRARQTDFDRDVAIKILKSNFVLDQNKIERFRREAHLISGLDHPNIVQVFAVGLTEEKTPFIAMEFLAGEQLSDIIRRDGAISWNRAIPLFLQMCDALSFAHDASIIHRDIKPSNIVVQRVDESRHNIKLVDFGIAKSLADTGPALTQTEMVLGSVFYLSPNQFQGRAADVRSDIWALACTFYEVLGGVTPFAGDNVFETIAKATGEDVAEIEGIPSDLNYLLRWMLSKQEENRPQSVAVVASALREIAAGRPLTKSFVAGDTAKSKRIFRQASNKRAFVNAAVVVALGATLALWVLNFGFRTKPTEQQSYLALNGAFAERLSNIKRLRAEHNPALFTQYAYIMRELSHQQRFVEVLMVSRAYENDAELFKNLDKTVPQADTNSILLCRIVAERSAAKWVDARETMFNLSKMVEAGSEIWMAVRRNCIHIDFDLGDWADLCQQHDLIRAVLKEDAQSRHFEASDRFFRSRSAAFALSSVGRHKEAAQQAGLALSILNSGELERSKEKVDSLGAESELHMVQLASNVDTVGGAQRAFKTRDFSERFAEMTAHPENSDTTLGAVRSLVIRGRIADAGGKPVAEKLYAAAIATCEKLMDYDSQGRIDSRTEGLNKFKVCMTQRWIIRERVLHADLKERQKLDQIFRESGFRFPKYQAAASDRSGAKFAINDVSG